MLARKKLVIMGDSISDCGRAKPVGEGLFGALSGGITAAAAGITAAVLFGLAAALFSRSRDKS